MSADYRLQAKGFNFTNRLDIHAMCTMAVKSARSGELEMEAEGYHFTGNYDFKAHGLGQCPYPGLPRAMVQMAIESAKRGKPIYQAGGISYLGQRDFEAIVDVLTYAIIDHVPEIQNVRKTGSAMNRQEIFKINGMDIEVAFCRQEELGAVYEASVVGEFNGGINELWGAIQALNTRLTMLNIDVVKIHIFSPHDARVHGVLLDDNETLFTQSNAQQRYAMQFMTDMPLREVKSLLERSFPEHKSIPTYSASSEAFYEITTAAMQDNLGRIAERITKNNLFGGEPAAIQSDAVLDRITQVIEILAERGEYITSDEWLNDKRHGYQRNKSLEDLASRSGEPPVIISDGLLYTERTIRSAPKALHKSIPVKKSLYKRSASLEAATETDNIEFWKACECADIEKAFEIWQNKDVDVDYLYRLPNDDIRDKITPMMAAARQGQDVSVDFLLDIGANPDIRSKRENHTALLLAAQYLHNSTVIQLVDGLIEFYKNDPDRQNDAIQYRDAEGHNILFYANLNCSPETHQYVIDSIQEICCSEPGEIRIPRRKPNAFLKSILAKIENHSAASERMPSHVPPKTVIPPTVAEMITSLGAGNGNKDVLQMMQNGKTLLSQAIKENLLPPLIQQLENIGSSLGKRELLAIDTASGQQFIAMIAHEGLLKEVLQPVQWAGKVSDLGAVWQAVPEEYRSQLNDEKGQPWIIRLVQQANQLLTKSADSVPSSLP